MVEMAGSDRDTSSGLTESLDDGQVIRQISEAEGAPALRRRLIGFVLGIVGILFASVYFLGNGQDHFNPMQALPTEAYLMLKTPDSYPLAMPTKDYQEIINYFAQDHTLGFTAAVPAKLPKNWVPQGANIIEYPKDRIAYVQFERKAASSNDFLFYFNFKGAVDDFKLGKATIKDDQKFYILANDTMNIVVYATSASTLGMFVSNISAQELATLL